ncbi:MAG: hypothetical protein HKM93_05885 [Desulfobacteraceae bacterium]|nr:hypothetical protein [Desulfobacteraceae bacterium]
MAKKRFKVESSCPQCGCSAVAHLSEEEIKEKYGDVANVHMECGECMLKYSSPMASACPEWDEACKMKTK